MTPILIAPNFFVAPQITPEEIAAAKARGVTLIINNRPDNEEPGQPKGADLEKAARAAGLAYAAIPVKGGIVGAGDLDALDAALAKNDGATLAFCRSGMRSTLLWALARVRAGEDIDVVITSAAEAGYDIAGQRRSLASVARSGR